MIGCDTGYVFRLAEKTDQVICLLDTVLREEREVVVCTITIYELLRHRMPGSLDPASVDRVLDNRAAFQWTRTGSYDVLGRAAGIAHGMGFYMAVRTHRSCVRGDRDRDVLYTQRTGF